MMAAWRGMGSTRYGIAQDTYIYIYTKAFLSPLLGLFAVVIVNVKWVLCHILFHAQRSILLHWTI